MSNIQISIIVPVYNVEKYLNQCIDSIIRNKDIEIEIILINDGSTDNSLEICEFYSNRFPFIHLLNQTNKGQSVARNEGLKKSKGKYIYFMDSDDFILENSLVDMYILCEKNNLDIVRAKYHMFLEDLNFNLKSTEWSKYSKLNKVLNTHEYFIDSVNLGFYEVTPILGLIKRDFLISNNIIFKPNVIMEDHIFTLILLTTQNPGKVMQIDYDFYTYRRRGNSTTTSPSLKSIVDIIDNSKYMINYVNTLNIELITLKKAAYKSISALIYQATSIYISLPLKDKKIAKKLLNLDIMLFAIKNSFNFHMKLKFILFSKFHTLFRVVYFLKNIKKDIKYEIYNKVKKYI